MAKETVGTRLPPAEWEQVEAYTKAHDISRTEVMELFIREGYECPQGFQGKRVLTGRIQESFTMSDGGGLLERSITVSGSIGEAVERQLQSANRIPGDFEGTEALVGRLPGEVVEMISEWEDSRGLNTSNAAYALLKRGMLADPIPDDDGSPYEGDSYTVELDPETAQLFRRCRLWYTIGPEECVNKLVAATRSSKRVRVGWEKDTEE